MIVAGYTRVSTREQGESGLSLQAQRDRIATECARRGWELGTVAPDVASGRSLKRRGQLEALLADLDRGAYQALVVTKLDRLTRSLKDFATIVERALAGGWQLVILDGAFDMSTAYGRAMANMAAVFAQLFAELVSENTKEGLAVARERGTFRPGESTRYTNPVVIGRIVQMAETMSHAQIADVLNLEDVQPPRGRVWHPRTVGRIIARGRVMAAQGGPAGADRQAPA